MQMPIFALASPHKDCTHVQLSIIHIEGGVRLVGQLGTVEGDEFVRDPALVEQPRTLTPEQEEGFLAHIGPAFAAFAEEWGDRVMYGEVSDE